MNSKSETTFSCTLDVIRNYSVDNQTDQRRSVTPATINIEFFEAPVKSYQPLVIVTNSCITDILLHRAGLNGKAMFSIYRNHPVSLNTLSGKKSEVKIKFKV